MGQNKSLAQLGNSFLSRTRPSCACTSPGRSGTCECQSLQGLIACPFKFSLSNSGMPKQQAATPLTSMFCLMTSSLFCFLPVCCYHHPQLHNLVHQLLQGAQRQGFGQSPRLQIPSWTRADHSCTRFSLQWAKLPCFYLHFSFSQRWGWGRILEWMPQLTLWWQVVHQWCLNFCSINFQILALVQGCLYSLDGDKFQEGIPVVKNPKTSIMAVFLDVTWLYTHIQPLYHSQYSPSLELGAILKNTKMDQTPDRDQTTVFQNKNWIQPVY